MNDFKENYDEERKLFFGLCGRGDKAVLVMRERQNPDALSRLACIALVFGFNKAFLRIFADCEGELQQFAKGIQRIEGNFPLLEKWTDAFIADIEDGNVKKVASEFWQKRKKTLDRVDLKVGHLFMKSYFNYKA